MTIVDRIYKFIDNDIRTSKDLAAFVGISASTVSDWKNKGTFPSSKHIEKIAQFFNTTSEYLITGKNIELKSDFSDYHLELFQIYNSLTPKQQSIIIGKLYEFEDDNKKAKPLENTPLKIAHSKNIKLVEDFNIPEYVTLKLYSQRASAGIGKYNYEEDNFEETDFDINEYPAALKADHVIVVEGDSMSPTITDGQYIFIREQNEIEENEIGVFVYEDTVYCKRLHIDRKKKALTLVSDNKQYKNIEIKNIKELRTIGKVIL